MISLTDFHSHILPGIDDGSRSVEESLQMLRREAQQGIRRVVATPHFYPRHNDIERFLAKRYESERRLREAMASHPGLPELIVGAEVLFFSGISQSDQLDRLTIRGKKCILIEMPDTGWTDSMYRELAALYERRGLTPIIAHIDRYIAPFRTHRIPERLAELPVLVQANAGFFLDPRTRGLALKLLRKDRIHLLGSDCHGISHRPPNLGHAVGMIRQKLGDETLDRICQHQHHALVNCAEDSAFI